MDSSFQYYSKRPAPQTHEQVSILVLMDSSFQFQPAYLTVPVQDVSILVLMDSSFQYFLLSGDVMRHYLFQSLF